MTVDRLTERLYVTVDSRDEARFLSNASSVTDSDRRLLGSGKADLTLFAETANLSTERACRVAHCFPPFFPRWGYPPKSSLEFEIRVSLIRAVINLRDREPSSRELLIGYSNNYRVGRLVFLSGALS